MVGRSAGFVLAVLATFGTVTPSGVGQLPPRLFPYRQCTVTSTPAGGSNSHELDFSRNTAAPVTRIDQAVRIFDVDGCNRQQTRIAT